MAASATITVALGSFVSPAAGMPLTYYATISNTGTNPATLNSCSVSCAAPGVVIAQPDFLTPNVAVNVGNPVIAASGTLAVRFSVVFPMPNTSGPSPQSPTLATGAVSQPAFPVSAAFPILVQCQITDSANSVATASYSFIQGVLSEVQNVPRAEGGALDFRQGSNILALCGPGYP